MNELINNINDNSNVADNSTLGKPKVFIWGTFDCLHNGHKHFLMKASQFGILYVIVVPSFAKVINKEYCPKKTEVERKNDLIHFGKVENNIIENVFIDCFQYGLKSLMLIKPDVVVLGYDQNNIWDGLLLQLLNYYGFYPQIIRFKKNEIIINHNGMRNNFERDLEKYKHLLEHKRRFLCKCNSISNDLIYNTINEIPLNNPTFLSKVF